MHQPAASAASLASVVAVCDRALRRGEQAEVKGILGGKGVGFLRHPVAWHDRELRGLIMLQGIHSA